MKSYFFQSNWNEIRKALIKDAAGCLTILLLFGILVFVFFDGNAVGPEHPHSMTEMLTVGYFLNAMFTSPAIETPVLAALISLIVVLAKLVAERPRAYQVAIVISAVLFALAHSTFRQGYGVLTFWPAFVMASLYSKFAQLDSPVRGLCLATVVHSIHNVFVFAFLFLAQRSLHSL